VGDAAHTIHPLAGQGVNLGYRDRCVAGCIEQRARHAEDWASHQVLKRYQTRRMADNFIMQSGMDLFYAGFSNDLAPVRILRNIGLMAAERAGGLKRQALKYASDSKLFPSPRGRGHRARAAQFCTKTKKPAERAFLF
jgi:2-octaprenyl-3-methyl-6-methoxy-1,4-benzoquinol hydroxylase